MKRLGHVPALDGVRGVAILLVLAYHLFWVPSGYVGVDLFFALSGFLITTLLLEERTAAGFVDLRAFYIRRARRLLPALAFMLVIVSIVYVMVGHNFSELPYAAAALFYVANFVRVSGHLFPRGLSQMWSLGQEEQFYLVWPALLIWLLGRHRPVSIARGLIVAAVLVALWRTVCWFWVPGPHAGLSPDTRSDALLLGCALAAIRFAGLEVPRWVIACATPAIAGFVAVSMLPSEWLPVEIPLAAILALPLLAAACAPTSLGARLLSFEPLRWLGLISYSVYIWHLAVFYVFHGSPVVKVIATIVVGALSYRWIEKPFRLRVSRARTEPELAAQTTVA